MARYSTLRSTDSTAIYIDDNDRRYLPGQPHFRVCDWIVLLFIYIIWVVSLPVTWCCSFMVIPQFERVIVFRLGRILPLKGPGLISRIPFVDTLKRVDMRTRAFKVPPQQILAIDRALLKVGADIQYRYVDPILTQSLQDLDHSLRVTGEAALNSLLSAEKLVYIKNEKMIIQERLQAYMNKVATGWGIEVSRIELEHLTVIKGSGGVDPNEPEVDGGAMIMNLMKSVMSSGSSGMSVPDVMMSGVVGGSKLHHQTVPMSSSTQQLLSTKELFCLAKSVINEDLCQQVAAIFEFHVSDDAGQTKIWNVDLKNSPGYVQEGKLTSKVDVSFRASECTFQNIFYGKLSPTNAYMNGSLVVDGSINVATKLEYLTLKLQSL